MDPQFVKTILETSVLGAGLIGVLWGCSKVIVWVGHEFVLPVKDAIIAHVQHLDEAVTAMKLLISSHGKLIEEQADVLSSQVTVNKHQNEILDKVAHQGDANTETLERIDQNVKELRQDSRRFFAESHSEHEKRSELLDRELDKQEE